MIKQIKNLMLVAVAAMGFVACSDNIEEATRPVETKMVEMTITAGMDDTRTELDETNKVVNWSAGDQLKVIENSATYRTTTAINIEGGKATFTVAFPANTTATTFTYNAIFPATAVVEDDAEKIDNTKVKVIVKDAQKPTATSFDPAADILVSKHIETEAQPTELNMQFKRLVAMGKMTLKNLPADAQIEKVIFTAAEGKGLAGRNYVDATTGEVSQYCYYGKTNILTINYDEAISSRDIYFTCNPFEMVAGETFKVKAVCGDKSYIREVEIPAGRSLTFTEGDLGTFSVDMTNATVETNSAFANGDYAVLAVSAGKYYALLCDANGTRLNSKDEYAYDGSGSIMLTDDTANMRWTITKTEDGYTFKGANDGYIAWYNNGNYARTQAEPYYLDIVEDSANAGRYYVVSKADATRKLQRNKDVTQYKYFAFYTSAQLGSLLLVPISENTDPYFTIEQDLAGYTADGDEIEFEVIGHNGFDAEVTATANVEWISFDHNGDIIYATAEPNEGAAREATITFSAEGYKSVEVIVKQDANPNAAIEATVAEFLAAKENDTTLYRLRGTITNVAETTYGNFDLTDETGTVYIYGLCSPTGATKYWAASGAQLGDDIEIITVRSSYSNSPQGKNAIFVEKQRPGTIAFWSFEKTSASFKSEGGVVEIKVSAYNLKEDVKLEFKAGEDGDLFEADYADGILTISAEANSNTEELKATLYVRSGDLEQTITISQAAYVEPGEGGDEPELVEITGTISFASTAQRVSQDGNSQVWQNDDITFTNNKASSSNPVANYTNPVRLYAGSNIVIDAPGAIKNIKFVCNSSSYATAMKNSIGTVAGATVTVSGSNVTVTFDEANSDSYTVAKLTAQVRLNSLSVTYLTEEE